MSTRPPTGAPPPRVAEIGDDRLDLVVLAREICDRYRRHYPDEDERYGPAGMDWCRHDNQWLLSWAVGDVLGVTDLDEQAGWLARVLRSRDFPIDRLAHDLRLAGDVVQENLPPGTGTPVAAALRRAAASVTEVVTGEGRTAPSHP
ncbi:MAG: hypothetical protein ACXWWQ_08360 [Candidatus Limnocylindria bacterium]